MNSILFKKLREEAGLSYNVECSTQLFQDTGYLYITTSVDNDSLFNNYNREGLGGALPILFDIIFKNLKTKDRVDLT